MVALNYKDLLWKIIDRGGLVATMAAMYLNDEKNADKFLTELSEQFHIQGTVNFLGSDLIDEIKNYLKLKKLENRQK